VRGAGRRDSCDAVTGDVVDVVLSFLHAVHVLLEADLLVTRLGGVIAHELSHLCAVCGILMDAKLDILGELFIELLVVVFLLRDLGEHLEALLDEVLFDNTQDLILLKCLTRDVQGKVLRVYNTLDKREPLWHKFVAVVHNEHATHVELDIGALLL
jgi:hypothetical protein